MITQMRKTWPEGQNYDRCFESIKKEELEEIKSRAKMTKKRQIELRESSTTDRAGKKSAKLIPMTFDEVAAIIGSGNIEKLKEIIETGRLNDINISNGMHGVSLLMIACEIGSIECARVLLDRNADINFSTYSGSVLKSACISGNLDVLTFIIENGVTINDNIILDLFASDAIVCNTEIATILLGHVQNVNGGASHNYTTHNLLHYACKAGNLHIVQILLERGCRYQGPLEVASRYGHLEVVKLLLGWKSNNIRITRESIRKAVACASQYGQIEVVRHLVEYDTNIDLSYALYSAVERNQVEVALVLIDSGADCNFQLTYLACSPWILACCLGNPAMVRLLLDRGADPHAVDARGVSVLNAALFHLEVLKMLLECGADPNPHFANGRTAVLELVQYRQTTFIPILTLLLEHGADPNLADAFSGETPLMRVVREHRADLVSLLLECGADPDLAHTTTGQTALMKAAVEPSVDIVKVLLEYGADVTQVNREGESVLDMLGRTRKYDEVRELCTQYIECNKPGAKLLLK